MTAPTPPGAAAVRRRRLVALCLVVVAAVAVLELVVGPADRRLRHGAELERLELESKATGETLDLNLVVPDGGEGSYWHDRAGGDWGSYVVDEVIPRAAKETGADPRRVAIGGISMGGYGALDIARLNPGRFCAVGGHSAALWQTGGESAPGAFDDADDFERHDVIAAAGSAPDPYLSQPVWIDSGDADPFRPGIDAFAAALESAGAEISFHLWPGEHEGAYWDAHWDEYLRFYAKALGRC